MAIEGSEGKVPQTEEKFSPPVFKKKTLIFVMVGVLLALVSLFVFARVRTYLAQRGLDQMVQEWDRMQKEYEAAQMADTYGGETPQETLRMFIEAMEKEDYELASKYFIIGQQTEELESMKVASKENIDKILEILRKAELDDKEAAIEEMYERDFEQYGIVESKDDYVKRIGALYADSATMSVDMGDGRFTISFELYPNGTWKIKEF